MKDWFGKTKNVQLNIENRSFRKYNGSGFIDKSLKTGSTTARILCENRGFILSIKNVIKIVY